MKVPFAGVPWFAVALGATLLLAATPPAWGSLAPALVLPGLAVQFALATGQRRPLCASYLLSLLHIAGFSWSVRHVALGGWVAVALLGGLYGLAAAAATRRLPGGSVFAFAIGVAGACWLRAEMPGIGYPHGQPCHDLWIWPWSLGPVRLGGEPLANALLAAIAAAAVQCWRGWRTGVPAFGAARRALGIVVAGTLVVSWTGAVGPRSEAAPTVAIAAIEPDLHPADTFADVPRDDRAAYERRWYDLLRTRYIEPTQDLAGPRGGAAAADVPELVLWPESSVPMPAEQEADGRARFDGLRGALLLQRGTRVCFGADLLNREARIVPVSLLVDEHGDLLGHQEKQRLVPAGETLPLIEWLPDGVASAVRHWLQTAVGLAVALPGTALPPLELPATGARPAVPFAALMCYDNAFPGVVASAVGAGARFVAVLSNESWFRGGGELDQLAAITVLRAIAAATPIVRCTTDGRSMAVDRDGRILAMLPPVPIPASRSRVLRVHLPLGDGRLPPLAWVQPWLGWGAAVLVALACLHGLVPWARLLRLGQAPAGGGGDPRPKAATGGS